MQKRIFEFIVLDPPTPMGRKRWSGQNNGKRFYTERKDIRSVHHIRAAFDEHYPDELPIQRKSPVKLSVKMWLKCPKSMSRKRRLAAWMKPAVVTKPDFNNIVNQVCDALTGYAYVDDAQIAWGADFIKFYAIDREGNDTPPRMTITVEEL
jgi:Holliday junction resolvase RusA-like endonuclease